jgi:tRNA(Ile)-lysidine synthase
MLRSHVKSILVSHLNQIDKKNILIGVSGGVDSVALLHIVAQLGIPVIVAHFDHQLRAESKNEEKAVEALCIKLGCEFISGTADVNLFAKDNHLSIEEAARKLRYKFLFDVAKKIDAQAILVGHHFNDHIETVMHNFLRGTGMHGLTGIHEYQILSDYSDNIPIVRPLLEIKKSELENYCQHNQLTIIEDKSNLDTEFTRNKIRQLLIPQLKEYNPNIEGNIANLSKILFEENKYLQEMANIYLGDCLLADNSGYLSFDNEHFQSIPIGIQGRVFRLLFKKIAGHAHQLDFAATNRALSFLAIEKSFGRESLVGGFSLFKEGLVIWVAKNENLLPLEGFPQIENEISLEINSEKQLNFKWKIIVSEVKNSPTYFQEIISNENLFIAHFSLDKVKSPLEFIASRQLKEIQPIGMKGKSIKLQDLYVNEKTIQRARKNWPVFFQNEKVYWVPGVKQSVHGLVKKSDKTIIKVEVINHDR